MSDEPYTEECTLQFGGVTPKNNKKHGIQSSLGNNELMVFGDNPNDESGFGDQGLLGLLENNPDSPETPIIKNNVRILKVEPIQASQPKMEKTHHGHAEVSPDKEFDKSHQNSGHTHRHNSIVNQGSSDLKPKLLGDEMPAPTRLVSVRDLGDNGSLLKPINADKPKGNSCRHITTKHGQQQVGLKDLFKDANTTQDESPANSVAKPSGPLRPNHIKNPPMHCGHHQDSGSLGDNHGDMEIQKRNTIHVGAGVNSHHVEAKIKPVISFLNKPGMGAKLEDLISPKKRKGNELEVEGQGQSQPGQLVRIKSSTEIQVNKVISPHSAQSQLQPLKAIHKIAMKGAEVSNDDHHHHSHNSPSQNHLHHNNPEDPSTHQTAEKTPSNHDDNGSSVSVSKRGISPGVVLLAQKKSHIHPRQSSKDVAPNMKKPATLESVIKGRNKD